LCQIIEPHHLVCVAGPESSCCNVTLWSSGNCLYLSHCRSLQSFFCAIPVQMFVALSHIPPIAWISFLRILVGVIMSLFLAVHSFMNQQSYLLYLMRGVYEGITYTNGLNHNQFPHHFCFALYLLKCMGRMQGVHAEQNCCRFIIISASSCHRYFQLHILEVDRALHLALHTYKQTDVR
jgi:hypothetical protein